MLFRLFLGGSNPIWLCWSRDGGPSLGILGRRGSSWLWLWFSQFGGCLNLLNHDQQLVVRHTKVSDFCLSLFLSFSFFFSILDFSIFSKIFFLCFSFFWRSETVQKVIEIQIWFTNLRSPFGSLRNFFWIASYPKLVLDQRLECRITELVVDSWWEVARTCTLQSYSQTLLCLSLTHLYEVSRDTPTRNESNNDSRVDASIRNSVILISLLKKVPLRMKCSLELMPIRKRPAQL